MTNIKLIHYKRKLNLPNDEFSNSTTNDEIRSYLIKDINWNNRKHFINFLDKTSFIYNSDRNEEIKESNKRKRDAFPFDVHNCIYNHRLISCFLG
jgi:hypothetical protein